MSFERNGIGIDQLSGRREETIGTPNVKYKSKIEEGRTRKEKRAISERNKNTIEQKSRRTNDAEQRVRHAKTKNLEST